MTNFSISEAHDILEDYNKLFKANNSLNGFVAGEALDAECNRMCKEIDAYHDAIMENDPNDEANRR